MKKRMYFFDMDGTLNEYGYVKNIEDLYKEGYFLTRPPHEKIVADVNRMIDEGYNVYLLSCRLTESQYAEKEKYAWAKKYLPRLHPAKIILLPNGENKAEYLKMARGIIVDKDCILIDDYTKNLSEWDAAGGTGVKYLNGTNGNGGVWKGIRVDYQKGETVEEVLR